MFLKRGLFALLTLLAFINCAHAQTGSPKHIVPLDVACIFGSASLQDIPPHIIVGLLKTEAGRVGSEVRNTDGSYDLGPIQVNNRVWVPVIARMHFGGDQNAAYNALRDHGCYNVYIGAWIFKQALTEAKGDYKRAVGYYNSHTPEYMQRYQEKFTKNFMSIFAPFAAGKGG